MRSMASGHLAQHVIIVAAMLVFVHAGAGKAVPSSQKGEMPSRSRVERLEKTLFKEKEKFELFRMKEEDILARLVEIEKEVAEKKKRVSFLRKGVRLSRKKVRALQVRMAILGKSLKVVEDLLMDRMVILYKYSRRGAMRVLATALDLDQFRLRLKYLAVIMREDQKALEKLANRKRSLEEEMGGVRREFSKAETLKEGEEKELSALKQDLENKVTLLVKIHREKEFYQIAVKELEEGAEDLKETLLDLEEKPGKYGGKMGASRFAENKGNLPRPLDGKIIRGKEVLGSTAANLRRGVYIEGQGEEKVRNIFRGRVDFSGSVKGYGEMIIINHGSRFFTIAAEMKSRTKKRGDQIGAGEVIGLVGGSGESVPARLYFEIRHGRKILDPEKWLKRE